MNMGLGMPENLALMSSGMVMEQGPKGENGVCRFFCASISLPAAVFVLCHDVPDSRSAASCVWGPLGGDIPRS